MSIKYNKSFLQKNNNGFSLAEVMVSLGITIIILLAGSSVLQLTQKHKKDIDSSISLAQTKDDLSKFLNDSRALANTLANNPSMACLLIANGLDCTPNVDTPFDIYNSSLIPALASRVSRYQQTATNGFTADGVNCSTYPSVDCPMRYNITWRPQCGIDTRCRAPNYVINAQFEVDSSYSGPPVNKGLLSFKVVKNSEGEKTQTVCVSMGGTYDSTTKSCALSVSSPCDSGKFFVGLDSSNQKICRGFAAPQSCPMGSVINRVDSSGNVYCVAGCYMLGINCSFNLWTGVSNCPTNLQWVTGVGLVANGPMVGFTLSPASTNFALFFNRADAARVSAIADANNANAKAGSAAANAGLAAAAAAAADAAAAAALAAVTIADARAAEAAAIAAKVDADNKAALAALEVAPAASYASSAASYAATAMLAATDAATAASIVARDAPGAAADAASWAARARAAADAAALEASSAATASTAAAASATAAAASAARAAADVATATAARIVLETPPPPPPPPPPPMDGGN